MIDLEKLLAPVSEDSPAGADLRDVPGDLTFEKIEEDRREIDPDLDEGGEQRSANWKAVVSASEEALCEKSKDLQLAAWLTEGLAHTQGFAGLLEGLGMLQRLLEAHWPLLHPGLDEGEIEFAIRARPLSWLGSSRDFLRAVSGCPIVLSPQPLCWYDYQNSDLVDDKASLSDPSQFNDLRALGYMTGEEWQVRLSSADSLELREVVSTLQECEAVLGELNATCDKLFDEDGPNLVPLKSLLYDIREHLADRLPDETVVDAGAEGEAVATGGGAAAQGPVASRDEALRRLTEVADYFRRAEPHSPISYLIERAVKWGRMPFDAVLREVIHSEDALNQIWDTLGIQQPGGMQEDD